MSGIRGTINPGTMGSFGSNRIAPTNINKPHEYFPSALKEDEVLTNLTLITSNIYLSSSPNLTQNRFFYKPNHFSSQEAEPAPPQHHDTAGSQQYGHRKIPLSPTHKKARPHTHQIVSECLVLLRVFVVEQFTKRRVHRRTPSGITPFPPFTTV